MAKGSGFYKGEKKKPKKGSNEKNISGMPQQPVSSFSLPDVIIKKKNNSQ